MPEEKENIDILSDENKQSVVEIQTPSVVVPEVYPHFEYSTFLIYPMPDHRRWGLGEDMIWHFEENGRIIVPINFITDFASIPKIFWNIHSPWGSYGKAAVLHDYLYKVQIYSRKKSDDIFLEAMKVSGTPFLTRQTFYTAVRLFAGGIWNKYKKELKQQEKLLTEYQTE